MRRLKDLSTSLESSLLGYREIESLLSQSNENAKTAPHLTCTNNGIILERLLKRNSGAAELPAKITLQELLARVSEHRKRLNLSPFSRRIRNKIDEVVKLRNQGAHDNSDPCTVQDAEESLLAICEIIDWFLRDEADPIGSDEVSVKSLKRPQRSGSTFSRPLPIVAFAVIAMVMIVYWATRPTIIVIEIEGVTMEIHGDPANFSPELSISLAQILGKPVSDEIDWGPRILAYIAPSLPVAIVPRSIWSWNLFSRESKSEETILSEAAYSEPVLFDEETGQLYFPDGITVRLGEGWERLREVEVPRLQAEIEKWILQLRE